MKRKGEGLNKVAGLGFYLRYIPTTKFRSILSHSCKKDHFPLQQNVYKGLVALQTVTIETFGEDNHGRTLGEVTLENGRNLNQELVKHGWCWWYRKYAPGNLVLMKMEADAKEAKLGLWKDPDPIPPWEFRHGGGQRAFVTDPSPAPLYQELAVRGNKRSRKYHRPDCPNYDDIAPIIEFLLIRHRRRKRRDLL